MNKKERLVGISSLIYLIILGCLFIASFITGIIKLEISKILLLVFVLFGIIGYIVVAIIRIKSYTYVCEKCGKEKSIDFFEYLFAKRSDDSRFLACENCKDINKFQRKIK